MLSEQLFAILAMFLYSCLNIKLIAEQQLVQENEKIKDCVLAMAPTYNEP